jgi:V8-like Glu-specific endopeptidase
LNSVFKITADATEGQSGSPIWVVDNGKRYLIGIIEAAGQTYNDVVALKADVVSQIRTWTGAGGSGSKAQELLDAPELD